MRRLIKTGFLTIFLVMFMFSLFIGLSGQTVRKELQVKKIRLGVPTQLSPANNSHFTHYPRKVTLRWKAVRFAQSYDVEIDCLHCRKVGQWDSENGPAWKVVSNLKALSYMFNFVGDNKGRWRVRAGRGTQKGNWSAWRYFDFKTGSGAPDSSAQAPQRFMLDFKDARLVFLPASKTLQIQANNKVLSYGNDWEKCQMKPYLYHLRQKVWKGFYWKVNTSRKEVYKVTGGSFCKLGGTEQKLNMNVTVNGGSDSSAPQQFFLNFTDAYLVYVPNTKTIQIAAAKCVLSYGGDWDKCNMKPYMYHLRLKTWQGFSWGVNTSRKKAWETRGGNFCKLGGSTTPLDFGVRVVQ